MMYMPVFRDPSCWSQDNCKLMDKGKKCKLMDKGKGSLNLLSVYGDDDDDDDDDDDEEDELEPMTEGRPSKVPRLAEGSSTEYVYSNNKLVEDTDFYNKIEHDIIASMKYDDGWKSLLKKLIHVHQKLHLHPETLIFTVNLINRLINLKDQNFGAGKYGVAAMCLACKYIEVNTLKIVDILAAAAILLDSPNDKDAIKASEAVIVEILEGNLRGRGGEWTNCETWSALLEYWEAMLAKFGKEDD